MLLGIKTDNPVAELYLYDSDGQEKDVLKWQADRELAHLLLAKIDEFLKKNELGLGDIKGLFVYEGPGSFTGLRIGITVMNTLAYSLGLPLASATGEGWLDACVGDLLSGRANKKVVTPYYGAEARITQPNK